MCLLWSRRSSILTDATFMFYHLLKWLASEAEGAVETGSGRVGARSDEVKDGSRQGNEGPFVGPADLGALINAAWSESRQPAVQA